MEATTTQAPAPLTRRLASGKVAVMEADGRTVAYIAADEDDAELYLHDRYDDAPTCSICDGVGHGYPGGGPCPLEVTDYSGEPWWAL